MKKYFIGLLSILVFVSCDTGLCSRWSYAAKQRLTEYKKTVARKYIDRHNHQDCTLKFSDSTFGPALGSNPLYCEYQMFWDYVQVGDTIQKIKNTNTYKVKRQGVKDSLFYMYHGCCDTLKLK